MLRSRAEWRLRQPGKFGTVTVRAYRDGTRSYELKGGNQGTVDGAGVSLETYIHALFGLTLQQAGRRVLIIGCATGSLATMLTRAGREVTLVDADRGAFKLARQLFGLSREVACHVGDGLAFLERTRKRFDVIILDAFIGEVIPKHFLEPAFFESARKRLKKRGLALVNVCLRDRKDMLARTIAEAFVSRGWAAKVLDEPGGARNAVVAAGNVRKMRRPRLMMPPALRAGSLRRSLGAMKFRATSSLKAPCAVPPSAR